MKDETYLYISDVKDRAKVARNSRYKKNGCKSKKCTLPTDYKTRKEIAAMNGEVKSFKMTEFYSWDDFLKMSDDIQKEYIEGIIKKYKCSLSAISIEVFGKSPNYLGKYVTEKMIPIQTPVVTGYLAKKGREHLKADVYGGKDGAQEKLMAVKSTKTANIGSATISIDMFDDKVWNALKDMFKDRKVSIMIDVHERYSYETTVGYGFIGNNE